MLKQWGMGCSRCTISSCSQHVLCSQCCSGICPGVAWCGCTQLQAAADGQSFPPITADQAEVIDAVVAWVHEAIAQDRKVGALKQLQGHVWRAGFKKGELVAELFRQAGETERRVQEQHVFDMVGTGLGRCAWGLLACGACNQDQRTRAAVQLGRFACVAPSRCFHSWPAHTPRRVYLAHTPCIRPVCAGMCLTCWWTGGTLGSRPTSTAAAAGRPSGCSLATARLATCGRSSRASLTPPAGPRQMRPATTTSSCHWAWMMQTRWGGGCVSGHMLVGPNCPCCKRPCVFTKHPQQARATLQFCPSQALLAHVCVCMYVCVTADCRCSLPLMCWLRQRLQLRLVGGLCWSHGQATSLCPKSRASG